MKIDSVIPEDLYAVCRSELLFADYDMTKCFNLIKQLFDIFKRAKKRFDRRDSLQVSPTVSQFFQSVKDSEDYPYILNDFRYNGTRICICQNKKHYYVYASGIDKDTANFFKDYKNYSMPNFYGDFPSVGLAQGLFLTMVSKFTEAPF